MVSFLRRAIPTDGWAPAWFVPGLGVQLRARGAPRCPAAAASAAGTTAWLRIGQWGPGQLGEELRAVWQACTLWATSDPHPGSDLG